MNIDMTGMQLFVGAIMIIAIFFLVSAIYSLRPYPICKCKHLKLSHVWHAHECTEVGCECIKYVSSES